MKKVFITALLMFYQLSVFSQELPEIIPPSPTAYELGKYGQVPIGFFTGTPNVSIPLYEYKTKNLSVPIALSYNSNGIKVDQQATNVGLGWSLNAGGVITRIVRDEPDEEGNTFFPEEEIKTNGAMSPMALDFFYLASQADVDTEPDIYMYNFEGYSGKFVFDNNKNIIQIPHNNLRIEMYVEGLLQGFKVTTPSGVTYIFLDQEINIHRLSGSQQYPPGDPTLTSWYLSKIIHPMGDEIYFSYAAENYNYVTGNSQSFTVPTSQFLPTCGGSSPTGYTISPVTSSHLTVAGKKLIAITSNSLTSGSVSFTSINNNPEISGLSIIADILVKDKNLNTIASFNFNYLFTLNKRVFLDKITFKNPDKFYSFSYEDPEGLVGRLSTSQDHWGYYNGKSNMYYFPNSNTLELMQGSYLMNYYNIGADKSPNPTFAVKGLLKKIVYPTKGYSEFEYEGNSYYGKEIINPPLVSVDLFVESDEEEFGQTIDSQVISNVKFDQNVELFKSVEFNENLCDPYLNTLHNVATISVVNLTNPSDTNLFYQSGLGGNTNLGNSFNITDTNNFPNTFLRLKANNDYEVKIKLIRPCNVANLYLSYYSGNIIEVMVNKIAGGLRIKRVKNYDSANNKLELTSYYYGKKETPTISSGEKGLPAYYMSKRTDRILCQGQPLWVDQTYDVLNSNSLRPLYNASGNSNSYYNYVTVSNGGDNFENGGEEYEFSIDNDIQGNPLIGDFIQSAPWTNYGWSNGLEKKKIIFKKNDSAIVVLSELTNNYKEDSRYFEEELGYAVQKKFDLILTQDITYSCKSGDLTKSYIDYYCATNHAHKIKFDYLVGHQVCVNSGANNTSRLVTHPCYGKQVGTIITYPDQLENLDITEYKTLSFWHYLESTIEKQYDQNGLNPVTTTSNYFYDNPEHLQVTRTTITTSDGKQVQTKTMYPDDVTSTTYLGLDPLTVDEKAAIDQLKKGAQHRIAEPIQVETYKDHDNDGFAEANELLSTQRTNYKDWNGLVLPESIETLKGTFNESTNPSETRIRFVSYYTNGNVKELSKEDGTPIVYLWGYQQTQPIAKIENATYAQVQSTLAAPPYNTTIEAIQLKSDLDIDASTENILRTALATLRTALPNAQVTTYTYDPLIGVTSITDPRGETIYYHYDNFNRLEYVKDGAGKILSKNVYHYKNQ